MNEHPGTGRPMEGIDVPADGTEGELVGDGTGVALAPIEEDGTGGAAAAELERRRDQGLAGPARRAGQIDEPDDGPGGAAG